MAIDGGVLTYRVEGSVALLLIDSPPVNALSHRVRTAIADGLSRAMADGDVRAIVLACAGRTFFAGADVTELGRPIEPPLLSEIIVRIEDSPKPVVAALHGTALGGGFELALACHYRVAVPTARVGLPEMALGLLPGAGGTQRVPRLVGVARAVEMIGLGKPLDAREALAAGLLDALAESDDAAEGGVAFAHDMLAKAPPLRRVRDLPIDLDPDAARTVFADFRKRHPELFVGVKAANGVLSAIEAAVTLPFDEGLAREREISRALTASPESAAQRHLFFAERAAAKVPGADGLKPRAIASVRIDGEGDEREAIALLARAAGIAVVRQGEAELTVATGDAPERIRFRLSGGVIEVSPPAQADGQAVVDALGFARRLAGAAVLARGGGKLIVDRLVSVAERAAPGVEDAAAIVPGLLGPAAARDPVDATMAEAFLDPIGAEALRLLDEGVALRGSDIDFAMVRAGRWQVWLGGPAFWAERQDAAAFAARLEARGIAVPDALRRRLVA